jgi:predicted SAM-dependent methyltransferase
MKPVFGWSSKRRAKSVRAGALDYLNLGCGERFHRDWVNVDFSSRDPEVIEHDLREPLPFPDASFSAIYHSHVLEHLPRRAGRNFIAECFRVAKPGAILRVAVPDLEMIARHYLKNLEGALAGDTGAAARYEWILLELLDQMVRDRSGGEMLEHWRQENIPAEDFVIERMGQEARAAIEKSRRKKRDDEKTGRRNPTSREAAEFRQRGEIHQWMYDRYSLARLLSEAGFAGARVCRADESAIPQFVSFELDTLADGSVRKPDSLFMEAVKPG